MQAQPATAAPAATVVTYLYQRRVERQLPVAVQPEARAPMVTRPLQAGMPQRAVAAMGLPAAAYHHRQLQVAVRGVTQHRAKPVATELQAAQALEHPVTAEVVATAARAALLPAGSAAAAAQAALQRAVLADRAVAMEMRLAVRAVRVQAAV